MYIRWFLWFFFSLWKIGLLCFQEQSPSNATSLAMMQEPQEVLEETVTIEEDPGTPTSHVSVVTSDDGTTRRTETKVKPNVSCQVLAFKSTTSQLQKPCLIHFSISWSYNYGLFLPSFSTLEHHSVFMKEWKSHNPTAESGLIFQS